MFDPVGNHAYYGNKGGIPGAAIDVDDIDGYGPEIFTYSNPIAGKYRVAVDSYKIYDVVTTASLEISVGGTKVFSGSYTFTADDLNGSNGSPLGTNPNAFWDAHEFDLGTLSITKLRTAQGSLFGNLAIFTTAQGENEVFITTEAPPSVNDSSIFYDINEVIEGYAVDSPFTVGRETSFLAKHLPLTSLTTPASHPLQYKIVAYTLDENGERDLESPPAYVIQDGRSQIRQEYVDKREFDPSFTLNVPSRDQIITSSQFSQVSPYFTFEELGKWSDYYYTNGLSVIGHSVYISNKLRTAWGYPLFVTSAWRNPRRNDRLSGSVLNSFHQTGEAVDIVPASNFENWPDQITGCGSIIDFDSALRALSCLAHRVFDSTVYDIVSSYHTHLHIERQTSSDSSGNESSGDGDSPVLSLDIGSLTILGEGIKSNVYWPETPSSGVTLGDNDMSITSVGCVLLNLIFTCMKY